MSGWAAASVQPKSGTDATHHVYLVPSASEPLRQGFVRVINHSAEAGEVSIDPVDDGGRAFDTIILSIDANETIHFNSNDLETGNEGKGLTGSTGSGEGDWRLAFTSDLDIEVLAYIRTTDGFLTAMHDVAPVDGDIRRVAIFNPGSNRNQVSRLRLINPTDATADVTIRGTDDKGMPGSGEVSLSLDAGTAREITAEQLESGRDRPCRDAGRRIGQVAPSGRVRASCCGNESPGKSDGSPDEPLDGAGASGRWRARRAAVPGGGGRLRPPGFCAGDQPFRHGGRDPYQGV